MGVERCPEPQAIDARRSRVRCCCGRLLWSHGAALRLVGLSDSTAMPGALRWLHAGKKQWCHARSAAGAAQRLDAGETQALLETLVVGGL